MDATFYKAIVAKSETRNGKQYTYFRTIETKEKASLVADMSDALCDGFTQLGKVKRQHISVPGK